MKGIALRIERGFLCGLDKLVFLFQTRWQKHVSQQNTVSWKGSLSEYQRGVFFVALTSWSAALLTSLLASFKPTMISDAASAFTCKWTGHQHHHLSARIPGIDTPGLMHRGWCTEDDAPGMMHRGWCTGVDAPGMIHRGWCTGDEAPGVMLWGWCTRDDALSKVYLSKVYFCEMYPTCVSSKLCEFIFGFPDDFFLDFSMKVFGFLGDFCFVLNCFAFDLVGSKFFGYKSFGFPGDFFGFLTI